jgi:two-component system sensor histidine kinase BaeS
MRLRLAHTLSLTLLAFACVAVLTSGGLTAWHLRKGFGEYLAARDVQHFERFVRIVEGRLAREDGLSELMEGRMEMHDVLGELNPRRDAPPGLSPSQGRHSDAFPDRIQVLAPNGSVLLGVPRVEGVGTLPLVERPVRVNGQPVALARMRPAPIERSGAEKRFLADQYTLIVAVGLGLMVLALLTAIWLARRWTRPLAAVLDATQRLARGELTVRLADGPALAGRGDEIGDVVRNVNRMAEGLQTLEGARRRWLADISHELRTPLTVLRGDIEALHDEVRPLRHEAVVVLHEEVMRLSRLVDDLHLLAISDLQTLPCHMDDDNAVAMMQRLQGRYLELLANLLENALRYTSAPGQVRMRLAKVGIRVRVVVEDSAPGVPAEQLSQVFEPLFRGDAARSGGAGGSGLGLSICQVIAKAHGGQLVASASALGGLCVTLDLPQPPRVPLIQPAASVA